MSVDATHKRKTRKHEAERPVTPRRRRPSGHLCICQRQGQTKQRQARQGQRQRETRTARTARTGQGQVQGWNCGKRGHYSKDCWSKKNTNKGCSKGKHKPKNADAHNLDPKPSIVEPEFEIDEFNMSYLDVDALQQQ